MAKRIYVQIPAYRDREIVPTVTDLLRQAARPDQLSVAIAWQYGYGEESMPDVLRQFEQVRLLSVSTELSQGCNWARSQLQAGWDGEMYTLFLDSHHRFVPGWDRLLIEMYENCQRTGIESPILTGYLPPYDPVTDPQGREHVIYRMCVAERLDGMVFRLTGHPVRAPEHLNAPLPAHFTSLHLLFTAGSFNEVVPFDPDIYFFADEIAIALRAFSHGYDLFHPHVVVGWHLYDRSTRVTHWADHPGWREQQTRSLQRLAELFTGSLTGPYGLGSRRNVSDYECYIDMRLLTDTPTT
jgi:UDP-N-acetylglucosamine (GlcNAc):hydroxyproline polypeptide GlcNAc-transferase